MSQNNFDYIKAKMNDTLEAFDLSGVSISECDYVFKLVFSRLTTCILPDSLQCDTIDLGWRPRLTTIRIHPDNPVYASINGVMLGNDKSRLICFPRGWQGRYAIPDSVTEIADFQLGYENLVEGILLKLTRLVFINRLPLFGKKEISE